MSYVTTEGTVRLSSQSNDVTLTLDASKPMTVRIQLDHCPCGSEHSRPGSYVDSELNS
ncbi:MULTISPECIES: hypothetical protein [Paenarthrobacter]|jgi:hypothetical protein|uniref:hypothetical protein n=1 Tax=Paenarthrobacter TaxID=1742992 RepID=UPI00164369DB|nr:MULTISPECIES: hypothetical protein [Paenarthrobacter]MDD7834713.1 hypothetical protein [Paenarthrobacter sp. AB444]MDP9936348.1 hypothetical protein [Paenarthrobacter nicotinovorans]